MTAVQTEVKPEAKQEATNHNSHENLIAELLSGKKTKYVPLGEENEIELSVAMVKNFITNKTRKGEVPEYVDCARFIVLCRARRLNPYVGDCYLVGYDSDDGANWSMIVAIQALLKRAEVHPQYDGMESGVVVLTPNKEVIERQGDMAIPGEQIIGGWAKVYRKDRSRYVYQRLSLATYNKGTKFWKGDPGGMICKTAECHALRQAFPSDVGGMYLEAEFEALSDAQAANASKRSFEWDNKQAPIDLGTLTTQADQPPAPNRSVEVVVEETPNGDGHAEPTGETKQEPPAEPKQEPKAEKQNESTGEQLSDDEEFGIWKADIDKANTNGRLDALGEEASKIHNFPLQRRIMDEIAARRKAIRK